MENKVLILYYFTVYKKVATMVRQTTGRYREVVGWGSHVILIDYLCDAIGLPKSAFVDLG
jgi:hypothetical protein